MAYARATRNTKNRVFPVKHTHLREYAYGGQAKITKPFLKITPVTPVTLVNKVKKLQHI
jgi:hypothetical protein